MARPEQEPDGADVFPGERPGLWLVTLGGRPQSAVDLADPTRLEHDYVRRVADVLDALAPPGQRLRALHVGGAGLTLPRYLAVTRPGSAQVVLEPHARLTELVRERAPLPARSGVRVRPVDGRTGLATMREGSWDVVVVDAFDDGGTTPAELLTEGAVRELSRVLGPSGTVVLNLRDSAPYALTRDVVAAVTRHFAQVAVGAEPATWKARRDGNLVLVAGPDHLGGASLERAARQRAAPYRVVRGDLLRDSLGGGTARQDAAVAAAPSTPG